MSEQNWIITFVKQDHLDEIRVLTTQVALASVLMKLLAKYPKYNALDSITIRPTDMTYYE
jgi:hypothetical protein